MMPDKHTIMKFLKECTDLKEQYSTLDAREYYLKNTISQIEKGPSDIHYENPNDSIAIPVILTSLSLGLLGTPFAAIILAMIPSSINPLRFLKMLNLSFVDAHPYWTHILFSFFIVSILAIPLSILICGSDKETSMEKIKSYQDALASKPSLEKELVTVQSKKQMVLSRLKQLGSQKILHPDYLPYSYKLLGYFERGRVDTLKEAINLLEHDLQEKERQRAEKEYQEEMRQQMLNQQEMLDYIADETGRAADAAQSAAAWSAAGAFLTAAEIERQKKKDRE